MDLISTELAAMAAAGGILVGVAEDWSWYPRKARVAATAVLVAMAAFAFYSWWRGILVGVAEDWSWYPRKARIRSMFKIVAFLLLAVGLLAVGLLAISGCATRTEYKKVKVAVPVIPDIPAYLLKAYSGQVPQASDDGTICFTPEQSEKLQDWMSG